MSQGRSILKDIITNFVNSIKPSSAHVKFRGKDQFGTEYFEGQKNPHTNKTRRWLVSVNRNQLPQEIPIEWEAWLKHKRKDPPTEEEIQMNIQKMSSVIQNAQKLEMAKSENVKRLEKLSKTVIDVGGKLKSPERKFPEYEEYSSDPYRSAQKNESS